MGEASISRSTPPDLRVTSISCGSSHSLALLSNGVALSWGRGEDGQLGHGDAEERKKPRAIFHLMQANCSAVCSGAEYSLALSRGSNEVYSWGWGDFGRLGHGDCNDVFIPQPIKALAGRNIVKVACGDTHTLAITDTGELFSFGRNQNGQLGLGTTSDAILPQPVESLRGLKVCDISCGAEHSMALAGNGAVYCWGWGAYGNLGDGHREDRCAPVKVLGLEGVKVTSVACGWRHSIAADETGVVYTFGWSKYGQLGHGDCTDQLVPKAVESLKDSRIVLISGGWRHTSVADDTGMLYSWGWNKFGQLGIGSNADSNAPVLVLGFGTSPVKLLSCGWRHTFAVTEAGDVFSWGRGVNGQLGHNEPKDTNSPVRLTELSAGSIRLEDLGATASPLTTYVPPADRYAVVPDHSDAVPENSHGIGTVPEMPATKKARS
ncbi:hypothetical protein WJX75_009396 [Coccomyxa subellipsoidea]|uniref:RCC1-like domain-containing protein n=1 Tax=Coccomyxa subellipsoidea TaxID=248742 RepID=A0ABR2YEC8_9CHLO